MADIERVTVSLPTDVVREIDRWETNRSKFVAAAVKQEIERRLREELRRSLDNPHAESSHVAEQGFDQWANSMPQEDTDSLVDPAGGHPVQWVPNQGWVKGK